MLRIFAVLMMPLCVRRRLQGGEEVSVCGVALGVMFHMRFPSLCVAWRVPGMRLRTCGGSWKAGS